ncbi:MAG: hypothetical protein IKQ77_04990, partial [Prevotella sp.]|nr:hypothetical protein [Prevotella sp.]
VWTRSFGVGSSSNFNHTFDFFGRAQDPPLRLRGHSWRDDAGKRRPLSANMVFMYEASHDDFGGILGVATLGSVAP